MRAITKFLFVYPQKHRSCTTGCAHHNPSCNFCPTVVPRRRISSSAFGRGMTTRYFSSTGHSSRGETESTTTSNYSGTSISLEENQLKDDETHRRKNKNQNKILFNRIHNKENDDRNDNNNINNNNNSKNWLIVGDGDLSYSTMIARELVNQKHIHLFATVLEEEIHHHRIYERSNKNTADILSHRYDHHHHHSNKRQDDNDKISSLSMPSSPRHQVLFGIDATRLEEYNFSAPDSNNSSATTTTTNIATDNNNTKFQTIEFNFPHWGGKTNAKRNRQLVNDFLQSSCNVLNRNQHGNEDNHDDDGNNGSEIIISLCEGQGGFPATTVNSWKQSWLVAAYAAEHGLLLHKLQPYTPSYSQTSYRGKDRPWHKDGTAQRYHFSFPSNKICPIDTNLQISCRHELRIVLPDLLPNNYNNTIIEEEYQPYNNENKNPRGIPSQSDIIDGDAVYNLVKEFVPFGIRMNIVAREILSSYTYTTSDANCGGHQEDNTVTLAIFLINYSGECIPLTRNLADTIRSQVEISVQDLWKFDIAKGGRLVSKPYPTHLLPTLIQDSKERPRIMMSNKNTKTK